MKKLSYIATLAILSAGFVVAQSPSSSSTPDTSSQSQSSQPMSEQTPSGGNSTTMPNTPGATVPDTTPTTDPQPGGAPTSTPDSMPSPASTTDSTTNRSRTAARPRRARRTQRILSRIRMWVAPPLSEGRVGSRNFQPRYWRGFSCFITRYYALRRSTGSSSGALGGFESGDLRSSRSLPTSSVISRAPRS
jgi:hypothetical protein